jgi:hypothetical protein
MKTAAFILNFLIVVPGYAQQSSCLERTIPVSTSGIDGSPLPELTTMSLEGTYQRKPVIVKSVALEERLPRVVLLVDTSGSMRTRVDATIDVAEGILSRLPANVKTGLAFFAIDTIPVLLPTLDRKKLIFELEALRRDRRSYRGYTSLWSALIESVKMFRPPLPGDSVYLISGGGDNKSKENEKDAERVLGSAGVRLFALLLQSSPSRMRAPEQFDGPFRVSNVIHVTGGTPVFATYGGDPFPFRVAFTDKEGNPTEVGQLISLQLDQLLKFYRVEITLPDLVDKPRDWKLRFTGSASSRNDKVTLIYPTLVWPCY